MRPSLGIGAKTADLQLGELAVQDRDRRLEPCSHPLDQLRRQRDVGYEQQHAQAAGQSLLGRREVHLRLAACDHAVQQRQLVAPDDLERSRLLRTERGSEGRDGDHVRQLEKAAVPPLAGPSPLDPVFRMRGGSIARMHSISGTQ
jgi:hypothetical protein